MTRISVVTATLNCEGLLSRLIHSLEAQSDQDFEWIVVDGLSKDATVRIANGTALRSVVVDARADFGIYDALNRGVRLASGDYYLTIGADDELFPDAISSFRAAISNGNPDIVAAPVKAFGTVLRPGVGSTWRWGGNGIVASHAVGTLIRRDLHLKFGYYSNRYPNAADMYFIRRVMAAQHSKLVIIDLIVGRFATDGVSSTDRVASLTDAFRIQLEFEPTKWVQFALFVLRIVRTLRHMPGHP